MVLSGEHPSEHRAESGGEVRVRVTVGRQSGAEQSSEGALSARSGQGTAHHPNPNQGTALAHHDNPMTLALTLT